jgi:UDP-galactose transporter B1
MNNAGSVVGQSSSSWHGSTRTRLAMAPVPLQVDNGKASDETDAVEMHKAFDAAEQQQHPLLGDANEESGKLSHVVEQAPRQGDALRLLFGAAGVYAAYLCYGHIQEDIFRFRSPIDGAKFQFAWFLLVLESVGNIAVGLVGRHFLGLGSTGLPLMLFGTSGASQVFAKAFTLLAMAAGLSFPVCILTKSAKIVPVMLGQLVLGGSSYSVRDYTIAAAIVAGTAMLTFGEAKEKKKQGESTVAGVAFILLSLAMDGVTAGLQKRLKHKAATMNKTPTPCDFLLYTNMSMAATSLTIALITGDWGRGWTFTKDNPAILRMVCQVCVLSAIGQSFIFFIVAHFDPLVCATVTTTRKIMSVIWSITTKGHVVSEQGCLGLFIAISALLMEVQGKVSRHQEKHRKYTAKTSM